MSRNPDTDGIFPESGAEHIRNFSPEQIRSLRRALERRKRLGDALVVEGLVRMGVKRLFGLSGFPVDGILKETATSGIEVIGPRTQFGATVMSGIENFIQGRLVSAVCVSAGPAVTNCATGIYIARDNHRPLLVLGSRRALPEGGAGAFQGMSFVHLMSSITKWSAEIGTARDILPMMAEAARIAVEGYPGPVYLELPEEVLEQNAVIGGFSRELPLESTLDPSQLSLTAVAELIQDASRPLIGLSEDLRWGWEPDYLRSLVEAHRLPFITTPMGRGLLPDNHPLCLNGWRRQALQKADLFVLIGGALDWRFRFGLDLAPGCKVVHVGLDEDFLGMNVLSAWQACLPPAEFVKAIGEELPDSYQCPAALRELAGDPTIHQRRPYDLNWVDRPGFVDPDRFLRGLEELLPPDAIVVIDGSICLSLANHYLRASQPFSWFDPGLNGCIGSGIPQAVGAKLASPDRPVVAVISDTGFGMSGFELETAARHGVCIKVIVFNNSGITGEHRQLKIFGPEFPQRIAQFQPGLRYDRMAGALGFEENCSEDADTALRIIEEMLASDKPTCLNLAIDPSIPVPDIW